MKITFYSDNKKSLKDLTIGSIFKTKSDEILLKTDNDGDSSVMVFSFTENISFSFTDEDEEWTSFKEVVAELIIK